MELRKGETNVKDQQTGRKRSARKKGLWKTRAFRSGGYSVVVSVVVTAVVVALNLFVRQIPATYTKIDMTEEGLYSLDEQTESIVGALDTDVTLTLVAQSGGEDSLILETLERYAALSDHVKVETLDPVLYPSRLEAYGSAITNANSVVVQSEKRSTVVDYNELYVTDYSSYYYTGSYDVSFDAENALTTAIDYVVSDDLPVVYVLTGHGEPEMEDWLSEAIEGENVELEELNLLAQEAVPEDADCLLLYAPSSDLSGDEADRIIDYMEGGGRLLLITDYASASLPNLARVTENYGLTAQTGMVFESDMNYCLGGYPHYLLPEIESHEITDPLTEARLYALMPMAHGIARLEAYRSSLEISDLLTTTDGAYAKADPYSATTLEREDGDASGPFSVGVAVTEDVADGQTRMVWFSASQMLMQDVNAMVGGGNQDLFLNALNWMCERENNISIRSKSLMAQYLTIPSGEASLLSACIAVVLPLAVLAIGVVVCVRRRKR